MIVPDFWAEARLRERIAGRQVTVRRFGWSELSEQHAQANAEARASAAMARIAAGEKLTRREPKRAYGGADGVPIREQVISRHGESVVTRNSYGARCLNTPDVLFADLDFETEDARVGALFRRLLPVALVAAAGLGLWQQSLGLASGAALVGGLAAYALAAGLVRVSIARRGGREASARARVEAFVAAHPDWHLRLYRTPAGLRVLALQATFDPRGDQATACFDALLTDPLYARMCRQQNCFRARVSAKPWRIGIDVPLRPRPGVWPIDPARMPQRERWVADYERAANGFAACRFVAALGAVERVDPAADAVRQLHDELSRADSGLPIA